jgi:hypothetical protein
LIPPPSKSGADFLCCKPVKREGRVVSLFIVGATGNQHRIGFGTNPCSFNHQIFTTLAAEVYRPHVMSRNTRTPKQDLPSTLTSPNHWEGRSLLSEVGATHGKRLPTGC